jgi:hypothetical protein
LVEEITAFKGASLEYGIFERRLESLDSLAIPDGLFHLSDGKSEAIEECLLPVLVDSHNLGTESWLSLIHSLGLGGSARI